MNNSSSSSPSPAAEAWLNGDMHGAQVLNEPIADDPPALGREGEVVPEPLEPMPPAPRETDAFVEQAATVLRDLGPEGSALVEAWGGASSSNFAENLSYARQAFADITANRPDLIEKVNANGLGNDPVILEFLGSHGRLQAGLKGEGRTMTGSHYQEPRKLSRVQAAQRELDKIYRENPPWTPRYKDPYVQERIQQLCEFISGDGPIMGQDGRWV